MKAHPAAELFPLMPEDELRALADDIAEHGQREPVVLLDGLLLDGRNRARACAIAGLKPKTRALDAKSCPSPTAYVLSVNEKRRHLTAAQRAVVAVEALPLFEAEAKARQRQGGRAGGRGRPKGSPPEVTNLSAGKATRHAAAALRAGARQVDELAGVKRRAPDVFAAVKAGSIATVAEAARFTKLPTAERERALARVAAGAKPADAIREAKRDSIKAQLEDVGTRQAKVVAGVFDVLVIDPPWPMEKIERDERPAQAAFDYPTMTEAELAELAIPAADDCHAWVWTTQRFLPMALRLLDAWRLTYVCTFVWHKPGGFQPIGLPQYNCEFSLYARRGSPTFLDTKAFPTCFEAPRGRHSEKPEAFYDIVRRVTAGRRIDMFNRRAIDGFDGWGKEAAE